MSESPNRFHCLDADVWIEVPDRVIGVTGNCYVGRDYIPKNGKTRYDVRIFVKEIKMEQEDHDTLINDNALKLSRRKSDDIDALIEKGVNLKNFGKYYEALQAFEKALELEPEKNRRDSSDLRLRGARNKTSERDRSNNVEQ